MPQPIWHVLLNHRLPILQHSVQKISSKKSAVILKHGIRLFLWSLTLSGVTLVRQPSNTRVKPLYQHVARLVADKWNVNGQCSLVVGATFPNELAQVREIIGDMPLLVPGIGAQGGDIAATVGAGKTANGNGMMINSSRAILYAKTTGTETYTEAARRVAQETRDAINEHRQ